MKIARHTSLPGISLAKISVPKIVTLNESLLKTQSIRQGKSTTLFRKSKVCAEKCGAFEEGAETEAVAVMYAALHDVGQLTGDGAGFVK